MKLMISYTSVYLPLPSFLLSSSLISFISLSSSSFMYVHTYQCENAITLHFLCSYQIYMTEGEGVRESTENESERNKW